MSIHSRSILPSTTSTMTSQTSFKQFSLENDMQDITQGDAAMDSIYKYDAEEQKKILAAKPWASE
jgi:hypothetical protein